MIVDPRAMRYPDRMLSRTLGVFTALVSLFVSRAQAHDTWFLPDQFQTKPNALIRFRLTSGMAFPELDTAIKPERVAVAKARGGPRVFDLPAPTAAAKSLDFSARFEFSGIAACWVTLHPKQIELTPDKVAEYLDEIGASAALKNDWQQRPRRWREIYTKHAKTFLEITPTQHALATSWTEPVGQPLEIVPTTNPAILQAGATLTVRVLKSGRPLPDFVLSSVRAGEPKAHQAHTTNTKGEVTFEFPKPGKWLLRGTQLRKSAVPDADWESDFTTLTFEVWPKP